MVENESKINSTISQENLNVIEPEGPERQLKAFLKEIENTYPEKRQKLSLRSFCFTIQELHKNIAVDVGVVKKKDYKRIFVDDEKGAKLLWELQSEFTNQELFSIDKEYYLRDFVIEFFRKIKFGEPGLLDLNVGKSVIIDCCRQSEISSKTIKDVESFVMTKADKLNKIKGIPDATAKEFFSKHNIKPRFSIKRFLAKKLPPKK